MTIFLSIAGAVLLVAIILFNRMIGMKNAVAFAFASVDTMLKRRYDLIPNLVSTCEKYMGYEQAVLKDVTEARARAMQASDDERVRMDASLAGQLKSVFAVAENYPELKASESFDNLQRALNEIEDQIAAARRAFNASVLNYNNACEMFPTNFVAAMMGYKTRAMFEIAEAEAAPVKVWR